MNYTCIKVEGEEEKTILMVFKGFFNNLFERLSHNEEKTDTVWPQTLGALQNNKSIYLFIDLHTTIHDLLQILFQLVYSLQ